MAIAELTKTHIAENFKKLVVNQPAQCIYVRDIIQASEINRNTFYYHFSDKLDLIVWIFRTEFAEVMLQTFPKQDLVYDTEIPGDKYTDLPFYINMRSESNDLELGEFWEVFGTYLIDQFNYYNHIFRIDDCNLLIEYLYKIYFVQLQKDVLFAAGDKSIPENEVTFLAAYFTNACVNYIINAMKEIDPYQLEYPDEDNNLTKYKNLSHKLIKHICEQI